MKGLIKALLIVGIVAGGLISIKIGLELWSTKVKKYFVVDKY